MEVVFSVPTLPGYPWVAFVQSHCIHGLWAVVNGLLCELLLQ